MIFDHKAGGDNTLCITKVLLNKSSSSYFNTFSYKNIFDNDTNKHFVVTFLISTS